MVPVQAAVQTLDTDGNLRAGVKLDIRARSQVRGHRLRDHPDRAEVRSHALRVAGRHQRIGTMVSPGSFGRLLVDSVKRSLVSITAESPVYSGKGSTFSSERSCRG